MLTLAAVLLFVLAVAAICGGCYLLAGDSLIGFVFGWQMLEAGFDLLGTLTGAVFAAIVDAN